MKIACDITPHSGDELDHDEEVANALPEGGHAERDDEQRGALQQPAAQSRAELAEEEGGGKHRG